MSAFEVTPEYPMRICLLLLVLVSACHLVFAGSPYAGQQDLAIKSLSSERMAGLEAGRGLGYAKAAELNGYPGPKHVLELADELDLSEAQRARTRELFEAMQTQASALGRELIAAEAALDDAFAERDIGPERMAALVAASARVEGDLRRVHLEAHLDQAALLSDEQVDRYNRLRGYDGSRSHEHHRHHRN